jgi:NADPH:quinone reductase-like Zn-dependent oxidoreductase
MKAVYITGHGDIEKLTYGEPPDPVPEGNEVLVRICACGVDHIDLQTYPLLEERLQFGKVVLVPE